MKKAMYLLPLLALLSCEKILTDYKIPDPGNKLTMEALLLSGNTITALVGESVYSLDAASPKASDDYTVYLFENNILTDTLEPQFYQTYYDPNGRGTTQDIYLYHSQAIVQSGKNYRLEASKSGFQTIKGETSVVEPVNVSYVTYDANRERYRVRIEDAQGGDDWYLLRAYYKRAGGTFELATMILSDPTVETFDYYNDPFDPDQDVYTDEAFLSDEYFRDGTKQLDFGISLPGEEQDELYFQVIRITEDYYRFRLTYSAYLNSDDFFSEPAQIYSNISNGYGVVASGAASQVELPR